MKDKVNIDGEQVEKETKWSAHKPFPDKPFQNFHLCGDWTSWQSSCYDKLVSVSVDSLVINLQVDPFWIVVHKQHTWIQQVAALPCNRNFLCNRKTFLLNDRKCPLKDTGDSYSRALWKEGTTSSATAAPQLCRQLYSQPALCKHHGVSQTSLFHWSTQLTISTIILRETALFLSDKGES